MKKPHSASRSHHSKLSITSKAFQPFALRCPAALWSMLLCVFLLTASPQAVTAQTSEADIESTVSNSQWPNTPEKLKTEQESDTADSSLGDEQKATLKKLYDEIASNIQAIKDFQEKAEDSRAEISNAPKQAEELESQSQTAQDLQIDYSTYTDLNELYNRANKLLTDQTQQNSVVNQMNEQINLLPSVKKELTDEITGIPNAIAKQQQLLSQLLNENTDDVTKRILRVTRWVHHSRIALLSARMFHLQTQQQKMTAFESNGIFRKQFANEQRILASITEALEGVQQRIAKLEKEAVQSVSQQAVSIVENLANQHPALQPEADQVSALAKQLDVDVKQSLEVAQHLELIKEELREFQADQSDVQSTVESLQSSYGVGVLLRRQTARMPNVHLHMSRLIKFRDWLETNDVLRFDHDQKLEQTYAVIQEMQSRKTLTETEEAQVEILKQKQTLLEELIKYETNMFNDLLSIESHEKQLIESTQEFQDYINKRILWIRSNQPLWKNFQLDDFDQEIFKPGYWLQLSQKLSQDFRRNPVGWILVLGGFGYLLIFRSRVRRELARLGEEASGAKCRDMTPTIRAVVLTMGLSLIVPGLLLVLGWRLSQIVSVDAQMVNFGNGLMITGLFLAPITMMRQVCRNNGLATAHFQWPAEKTNWVRAILLRYATSVIAPIMIVFTLFEAIGDQGSDVVERIFFVVVLVLTSITCYRMTHPTNGVFGTFFADAIGTWAYRLRYVWFVIAVGLPLTMAGLVIYGYYHTAMHLSGELYLTIWILVSLLLVKGFFYRLLLIYRRRLLAARAQERLAAMAEKSDDSQGAAIPPPQEETISLSDISEQSRELVNAFLVAIAVACTWWIWSQELPALQKLDQWYVVEFDQHSAPTTDETTESGEETASTATMGMITENEDRGLSYADTLIAIFITFVTLTLSKNLPALMEIAVLQHLPFQQATRYAITSLISYLIGFAGIMLGAQMMGIGWSQVQWLVTALTFGLGFGLQEIFANFVAGIILLIERPIRVGDIVTVDGVTGSVAKIRMRATTIINWDRQEFIIPNKDFITGRLLNWTLTDKINRVVINVGLAYGSDVELARKLLLQVADENPLIMKDPGPIATFEGFGDSTLNLVLRSYLPDLDNRLGVINDLHAQIHDRFAQEGLEIAFPQLDLNIKQVPQQVAQQESHPQQPEE